MSDDEARKRLQELVGGVGGDAQRQLDYLEQVIDAVGEIGHPRIKPLKKKLNATFARVGKSAEAGRSEQEIARDLMQDIQGLRQQTYELLTTVVSQLRATLGANRGAFPPAERAQAQKLLDGFGTFAQAMRKMNAASKKNDPRLRREAMAMMDKAHAAMGKKS